MKKLFLAIFLVILGTNLFSQKDTTFYFHDNEVIILEKENGELQIRVHNQNVDSAENILFEGIYNGSCSNEVNTSFAFSKFIKKTNPRLTPHCSGLYAGFSNLASRDLNIGNVPNAVLKFSSYEIGWTMFSMNVPLSERYGWLFYAGAGLRVQQYNADQNTAFRLGSDGNTYQIAADSNIFYSSSKLTSWYINIPLLLEYQKRLKGSTHSFFIQFGVDCGIRLTSKSKVKYRDNDNKDVKEYIGSIMNINPLTVDARVEIGFGDLGLYARYGLINAFRKGREADVIPVAAGIIWHF